MSVISNLIVSEILSHKQESCVPDLRLKEIQITSALRSSVDGHLSIFSKNGKVSLAQKLPSSIKPNKTVEGKLLGSSIMHDFVPLE